MNTSINTMNSINSPLTFKATLNTRIKSGAMPEIADEFAKITKNVKGTLDFGYASSEPISSGLKEFVYNGVTYVTREANKYIEMEPESLSKEEVKTVAQKFADVLSALKIENAYLKKTEPRREELLELEKQVKVEQIKKERAEKHNLQGLVEVYSKNIEKLQSIINKKEADLEANEQVWYDTMCDKLNKYKGHELLDSYVDFVNLDYIA